MSSCFYYSKSHLKPVGIKEFKLQNLMVIYYLLGMIPKPTN